VIPTTPTLALSVRQPWAWAIAASFKRHENRTWRPSPSFLGQRIAIHASKTIEYPAVEEVTRLAGTAPVLATGAVIGVATLVDVVTESDSPWFIGPIGFVFDEAVLFANPVPCAGALNFFRMSNAVRDKVAWALHEQGEVMIR
jgi:hypothetical protein